MVANLISLSRLVMAAAFVHWAEERVVAVAILCAAGISDWLDGFVARRFSKVTPFGRLLDPICDRLFIVPVLATLVVVHGLPAWQLAVLVARDIATTLGGLVVWARRPERIPDIRARLSGKIVTSLQFWSIVQIVLGLPFFEVTFAAVAVATAWALVDYARVFRLMLGASKSVSTP